MGSLARAAALLALLVMATPASATVARFLPMAEHVDLSQLVIRVRVGPAKTFTSDKDGRPRTDQQLVVLESYKGGLEVGKTLTLRQMRGPEKDEGVLRIPGDPEMKEGEEAVLFLVVDEQGVAYLTALAQSHYAVGRDLSGAWVKRSFDGLSFVLGDEGRVVQAVPEAPVALSLFAETVRKLASEK